jgi:CRP-like cAMP-binding protein
MQSLFRLLESAAPLSNDLKAWLLEHVKREEIKSREYLLRPGEVAHSIYFIEKGLFRGFDNAIAPDQTIWLMAENELMIAVNSFYSQTPGDEGIQALEDSVVYSLGSRILGMGYELFPGFNLNGRVLTQQYYARVFPIMQRLRMKSAVERYHSFLQCHPGLEERVPSAVLSSFLGMSRDTLYRARIRYRKG